MLIRVFLAAVSAMLFALFMLLRNPSCISVYGGSQYIDQQEIKKTIRANNIFSGWFWLPMLESNISHIKGVKSARVASDGAGGLQILLSPQVYLGYLAGQGLVTSTNVIERVPYNQNFPIMVFDTDVDSIAKVESWLESNKLLIAMVPAGLKEVGYDRVSGQWRLFWDNNMLLLLGHTNIASSNFRRWLGLLSYFSKHKLALDCHVFDLRYPEGFSLSLLGHMANPGKCVLSR